jgi:hypothetical protein
MSDPQPNEMPMFQQAFRFGAKWAVSQGISCSTRRGRGIAWRGCRWPALLRAEAGPGCEGRARGGRAGRVLRPRCSGRRWTGRSRAARVCATRATTSPRWARVRQLSPASFGPISLKSPSRRSTWGERRSGCFSAIRRAVSAAWWRSTGSAEKSARRSGLRSCGLTQICAAARRASARPQD